MKDINTLLKQVEKAELRIEELQESKLKLSQNIIEETRDIKAMFLELKDKAEKCLAEVHSIIVNVCYIYANVLSINTGKLYLRGQLQRAEDFDSENCFKVLDSNIEILKTSLASLVLHKGDENSNCKFLCRSHQTIYEIHLKAMQMCTLEVDKASRIFAETSKSIEEQLKAIEVQKQDVIFELNQIENTLLSPDELFLDSAELIDEYPTEINVPLAYSSVMTKGVYKGNNMSGKVSSVLEWNLSREGVLHISADKQGFNSIQFMDFINCILLRCLYVYPAASKRILLCDNLSDARVISFAGVLSDSVSSLFLNGKKSIMTENSETDIATAISGLNELISRRLILLGRTKCDNILRYNAENQDNVQPLIFVLLHGYPHGYLPSAETLTSALKNGRKAGVYYIVTSDLSVGVSDNWGSHRIPEIKKVADINCVFNIGIDKSTVSDGKIEYLSDMMGLNFNSTEFLGRLKTALSEETKSIDFYSIIPSEEYRSSMRRERYSKTISLPVGKDGAKTLTLDLDSEGDAHVIICGTTGSGKSSLINTLVLSAATLYSPEELEINLISMVKSEFDIYGKYKLPHLKTLVTKDDIVGAIDVLNYLQDLMQSRMNIVGSDIVSYNANVPKEKRVPRSLIIIDEYQKLIVDERARDKMATIAQLGRSCGMCLILSSQIVPVEFRSALSLFRHLFEFRSSNAGELIPEASGRKGELEGLPGLCFYGRGGGMTLARIAYPGKTQDGSFIEKLNKITEKFDDYTMSLNSAICETIINDSGEIPFISTKTQREYEEDGVCKIRLGRKHLSNVPLEYPLSYKNSLLCICGEYLLTKNIEAAIIKDVLYLSRKVDYPTLYYIDLNKNPNWARKKTVIKEQKDNWLLNSGGRFAFYGATQFEDLLGELEDVIAEREARGCEEDFDISPIVVMISCAEQIGREADDLLYLMKRGKNYNVFFILQFNEFSRNVNEVCREINIIEDAVLMPDRYYEGEPYASSGLISFLEQTEVADNTAKDMLRTLVTTPLNPKLNILCNNNEVSCFIPYGYTNEFFKNLLNKE